MGLGFNSRFGLYVQMVSQSILTLVGFLWDLQFPPAFKIGAHMFITSKTPFTQEYWGAAVLKSGCYNVMPYGLHAYMKRHDSDDSSPVVAKLQRFGSLWRKALYKYKKKKNENL